MRVVVSQTFRASRIKKGRDRGLRAILQRRARRENHSIASTATAERRNREVPPFLINTFLFPSFLISTNQLQLKLKVPYCLLFSMTTAVSCSAKVKASTFFIYAGIVSLTLLKF